LAFLPSEESDPEGRASNIKVLEELVKGPHGKTFKIMWVDGVTQSAFKESFSPGPDLPRLVAFASSKKRFSTFMGAFTTESIGNFLEKVLAGKTSSSSIDPIPTLTNSQ